MIIDFSTVQIEHNGKKEPSLASPSWWGVESIRYKHAQLINKKDHTRQDCYFKQMEFFVRQYIDIETSFTFAELAGEQGIGPQVYFACPQKGALAMQDLSEETNIASLDLFYDKSNQEKLLTLHKKVEKFTGITQQANVFQHIEQLIKLTENSPLLPDDFNWLLKKIAPASQQIESAGYDLLPCHGGSNVSNILVSHKNQQFLLIDWDYAGLMDPFQNLGIIFAELNMNDLDAKEAFEMYWQKMDERLFNRTKVYGIADCIRQALISIYADTVNPGVHEYTKYADWLFLRARTSLNDPLYDIRLNKL